MADQDKIQLILELLGTGGAPASNDVAKLSEVVRELVAELNTYKIAADKAEQSTRDVSGTYALLTTNITATRTVANSSKKPSTHRWMIQKRQLSITAKFVRGPKKSAGR